MKAKLPAGYIYVGNRGTVHALSLVSASVSIRPSGSWLVDFVGLLVELLSLPFYPSPNSSTGLPVLHPMFDCESLHLFQFTVGWSFSGDGYARCLSPSISEYH